MTTCKEAVRYAIFAMKGKEGKRGQSSGCARTAPDMPSGHARTMIPYPQVSRIGSRVRAWACLDLRAPGHRVGVTCLVLG